MFWLFFFVMTIQSVTVVESIASDLDQVAAVGTPVDPRDLTIIAHVNRSGILELACDVGYHQEGVKCVPDEDVPYGGGCFADGQCIENLFCPVDKCRCKDYQHFSQQTNRCEEDVDVPYGEPCLEDRQCNNTLLCIRDKCSCQSYDYYSNQTKTCKERTYKAPCTTSSHCRTNLICAGNNCVCYSEQFFNHSDETCKPRFGPNEGPCSSSDQCTSSLVCDDSTEKCVCELYQQNSLCNTTLQCSKSCSSTSQCRSPSSCINNICTCPGGWYCDRTLIDCYPSLEHSKKCQSSVLNMCSGKDIRCVQDKTGQERCLCGNDMYRLYRSSTCRSIQELQVSPTLPAQRLTDKVTLTWPENNLGLPVTYKVQWESVEQSQDKGETTGSRSGVIVSGLTPGREYKFKIVSTLAEDQYYSQKTVEFADTFFTYPAKPGLINTTLSDLENPPYIFRFIASDGDVVKYRFTLTDGSLSQTVDVNSAQVEFSTLRLDTMYQYTIVAISRNNEQSEPVNGTIEIKSPIRFLHEMCMTNSQCNANLMCQQNICDCSSTQYYNSSIKVCNTKLGHSAECQSGTAGMCMEDKFHCAQDKVGEERCLCGNDLFYHDRTGVCKPIQELQVHPTTPVQRLTDKVNFTWPENNLGLPVTYKVQWESIKHSQDKGETTGSRSGVIVSGLTPGREYKFKIVSILAEDQYYSQKTVKFADTFFTYPAKPDLINMTLSDLENPPYVFRFIASDGDVVKYRFTLTDGSLSQTVDVDAAQVEFSTLRLDTMYQYTIVAFSRNNEQSEPVVGTIEIEAPIRFLNEICLRNSQCNANLMCQQSICVCSSTQYYNSSIKACNTKLGHTSECQSDLLGMCMEDEFLCIPDRVGEERCLCGNDLYYHNRTGVCKPVNELKLNINLPVTRRTNEIDFSWPESNVEYPVTYHIQWEATGHNMDKGDKEISGNSTTVTDLTPGREYKFKIVSSLAEDQYYNQKTVITERKLMTVAAKPGLINVTKSEVENPPYVLKFDPPEGDVAKYQFTLTDGSLSQTLEVNSPQVEFSSLKPDTIYEYTVIAINKNGDQSEPVAGKIHMGEKTQAKSSDDNMMIIIIASSGSAAVIIIAVIVGLIIFVVHKKRRAQSQREEKDPSDETPYISPDGSIYDFIHENGDDSSYGRVKHNRDSTKSDPYTNPDASEDEGMGSEGTFSTSMDTHTDNEGSLGYVTVRDSLPDEQLKPGWPADKSLNTDMKREEAMMNDYIDVIEEDAGKKENE